MHLLKELSSPDIRAGPAWRNQLKKVYPMQPAAPPLIKWSNPHWDQNWWCVQALPCQVIRDNDHGVALKGWWSVEPREKKTGSMVPRITVQVSVHHMMAVGQEVRTGWRNMEMHYLAPVLVHSITVIVEVCEDRSHLETGIQQLRDHCTGHLMSMRPVQQCLLGLNPSPLGDLQPLYLWANLRAIASSAKHCPSLPGQSQCTLNIFKHFKNFFFVSTDCLCVFSSHQCWTFQMCQLFSFQFDVLFFWCKWMNVEQPGCLSWTCCRSRWGGADSLCAVFMQRQFRTVETGKRLSRLKSVYTVHWSLWLWVSCWAGPRVLQTRGQLVLQMKLYLCPWRARQRDVGCLFKIVNTEHSVCRTTSVCCLK